LTDSPFRTSGESGTATLRGSPPCLRSRVPGRLRSSTDDNVYSFEDGHPFSRCCSDCVSRDDFFGCSFLSRPFSLIWAGSFFFSIKRCMRAQPLFFSRPSELSLECIHLSPLSGSPTSTIRLPPFFSPPPVGARAF